MTIALTGLLTGLNVLANHVADHMTDAMTDSMSDPSKMAVHGSWFGVGDGTIVVWSLVWVVIPVGIFTILGMLWAGKTGHFKNIQEIADRQIELDD
jgi:hypothetical protein